LGPCLVSWIAKKQPTVAHSSTEVEYRAMAITAAELHWIRMLFKEMNILLSVPPTLWVDNLGALALAFNPVFHARTKHVELDYHFIREKIVNHDLTACYISTIDQLAYIFTKGLTTPRFLLLWDKLKVSPLPMSLQGDVNHIQTKETNEIVDVDQRKEKCRESCVKLCEL
jgi:hypothetical protein